MMFRSIGWMMTAVLLAHCASPVENWIGLQCDLERPCKVDLVCNQGRCERFIPPPTLLPECSLDIHCENNLGVPRVCHQPSGTCVRCLSNADCSPNFCTGFPTYDCVGCLSNADCDSGKVCNPASAFCSESLSTSDEVLR